MPFAGGLAAGAVMGAVLAPRAPDSATLEYLIKNKPEFYKFIDIDLSVARTNQVYDEPGEFIWIDNQFARGSVELALNEQKFDKYDLRRQKYISGEFYRFYITNVAGQGTIRLFISRGYHAASEPIESITRAELAVRLGSIVSFDRRGDVLWYDDFEDMLNKWTITADAGCSASIVASPVGRGGFACKLETDATLSNSVEMRHILPYSALGKCGFEVSFTIPVLLDALFFYFYLYTGVVDKLAACYINISGTTLGLWTSVGWQSIDASFSPLATLDTFHTLKLVSDFENDKYMRLLFDSSSYDISDYALSSGAFLVSPNLDIKIDLLNYSLGAARELEIDNVIITQNEP